MTEEATPTPPKLTAEVTVESGAVFALTESNAIFRNGHQLVIPHLGVPFLQELMEALTSEPFVTGIIENYLTSTEVTDEVEDEEIPVVRESDLTETDQCDKVHGATGARCLKLHGHEGPHAGWQGGPEDWGGGDDIVWEDVTLPSSRDIPEETTWEGFTIHAFGPASTASVFHPKSTKRLTFQDREGAMSMLSDPYLDFYDRLCAQGYIEWFDVYFPGQEDWRNWKAGDALVSDQGTHALVVPASEGLAIINSEGSIFAVSDENADIFSHWTVSNR